MCKQERKTWIQSGLHFLAGAASMLALSAWRRDCCWRLRRRHRGRSGRRWTLPATRSTPSWTRATHHLAAKAVVSFTAPPNLEVVNFGFHPALKVTKITDESGKLLEGERTADGSIRVTPGAPFVQGQTVHWTFEYEGTLTGNEDGPIEGLKLAAIQEPISYLLYPARWFPTTGYMTDRFTAEMHIRVPQGMKVFASGAVGASKPVTLSNGKPGDEYDFSWKKPGFPGTVIAGRYVGPVISGRRQREGLREHQPPGIGEPTGADGDQGVRLFYRQLWRAGDQPPECD